ncbi:purine-nucleoside phosphorylase, partial [Pectobacterium brasiliense]|nr:purine-nucleoside phosphorylase [Pectobacterium brasiliense]
MGACSDYKVNRMRLKYHDYAAIADFDIVLNAVDAAKARVVSVRVGNFFSAYVFSPPYPQIFDFIEKYGILGLE